MGDAPAAPAASGSMPPASPPQEALSPEALLHASAWLPFREAYRLGFLSARHLALWRRQFLRLRLLHNGQLDLSLGAIATDANLAALLARCWVRADSGEELRPLRVLRLCAARLTTAGLEAALARGTGLGAAQLRLLDLRGCGAVGLEALAAADGNDLATLHQAERPPWAPAPVGPGARLARVLSEGLPELRALDLSDCGRALGSSALALDMQQSNVASVDAALNVYAIGDAVLREIVFAAGPRLRRLRLYNCCAVGDSGGCLSLTVTLILTLTLASSP
uniref:Uncharacterized protein n=1 Tax=Phaeomonas parva TaxID=124430 RepID=A0A7S1UEM4_9STRA|mmetsp:Transcript_44595/g.139855  ORF Transcript_44595/g.139855 Transcript_44595/m.139855 type:complete len:279 (+) Transcript_44595:351-1187(+)